MSTQRLYAKGGSSLEDLKPFVSCFYLRPILVV